MISATAPHQTAAFTAQTGHVSWAQRLWRSVVGIPSAVQAQTSGVAAPLAAQACSPVLHKNHAAPACDADLDLAQRVRLVGEW